MSKERNLLKLLSDTECLQACREAIKNAKIHKQTAEATAVYENYGIAVSHLILSTEELTKGLLLYIQSLGLEIRNISGIHLFFTDHIIKHRLATFISIIYPMLKLFMGIVYKMKDKLHNPNLEIEYTENENALLNRDEPKIEALFSDISDMMDWWDEANKNKNKGFYIDYSGMLETPMQVTKLQYKQAFTITDSFETQLLSIIAYFDNASDEDKKQIADNKKLYRVDKILLPVIESRKLEMNNKRTKTTIKQILDKN